MKYLYFLVIILAAMLTACGNDEEFVINCEIKGLGDKGVEMYYYDRGVNRVSFHPKDGEVELRGSASELTPIDVFTLDNELLFTCMAKNGDELDVKMDLAKPGIISIKGNEVSEEYAKFLTENVELLHNSPDAAKINALITERVKNYPTKVSSSLILMTLFRPEGYEMLADSLIHVLDPAARPGTLMRSFSSMIGEQVSTSARGNVRAMTFHTGRDTVNGHDTIVRFMPSFHSYGLLVFVGADKSDTITNRLNELVKDYQRRRLEILELSLQSDSTTWRNSINSDSAKWVQAWVPGGNAVSQIRNLSIPKTPFFIITDSMGKQVYRGGSITAAVDTLRNRLKAHINRKTENDSTEIAGTEVADSESSDPQEAEAPTVTTKRPPLNNNNRPLKNTEKLQKSKI